MCVCMCVLMTDETVVRAVCVVNDDDLPVYSLLYWANFTALDPGPLGKTPDYKCSNNYGHQFFWRIASLRSRISGQSSMVILATDVPNCASSSIGISVSPASEIFYHSEYSWVHHFTLRYVIH